MNRTQKTSRRPPMNNLDQKGEGGCSIIKIFWPIELNDLWSKKICRPEMIVWSGATFILIIMILLLLHLIHSAGQGTLSKERSWRPGRIFPLQGVWKELQQRPVVERSRQSSPKKAPVRPVQRGHAYTINTEDSHQICSSERKAGIVFHVQVQRKDRSRYSESHEDSRQE